MFELLISSPPFSLPQREKERLLLSAVNQLTRMHGEHCQQYRRILDAMWGGIHDVSSLANVPFLPVAIFKEVDLVSTRQRVMLLVSSGTTGQSPSRIFVDAETSARQSRALVETLKPLLGDKRLPFLIIDTKKTISNPEMLTARGAGVLGLMKFGAKAEFALDPELKADRTVIKRFLQANGAQPFLIFGFTFLVWSGLYEEFQDGELDLSNAVLIHSGGWKKMVERKVDNLEFRSRIGDRFGLRRIYNFYGMVEQVGSVFLEGDGGLLYPPNFADVIIRDERTWEPLEPGRIGLVQTISALPRSYPGHSVLTEDIGEIVTIDAGQGGRMGKAIRIHGRVPKAELRGCSDVAAAA